MADLARLNICLVAGTLASGGAERQLYYVAKVLKQSGAQVRVLSLQSGEFWEAKLVEIGVPVTWVGKNRFRLARLTRILWEIAKQRPHIVQSQHFYTNLYVVAAARLLRVAAISAIRGNVVGEMASNGPLLGRLSLRSPRLIAANSRAGLEAARRQGVPAARLQFLPNVVDTERFRPCEGPSRHSVRVLAVGRLSKEKRFDRFLVILAQLRQLTPLPFQAHIIGDGPLRAELVQLADRLGLSDLVQFRGAVADMEDAYRQADVLALTSDAEGTPNVVMEAMACGLAVVSTRVGGVRELLVDNESGFLVSPGDNERMAQILVFLMEHPEVRRRIGDSARASMQRSHSVDQLRPYLSRLYARALIS